VREVRDRSLNAHLGSIVDSGGRHLDAGRGTVAGDPSTRAEEAFMPAQGRTIPSPETFGLEFLDARGPLLLDALRVLDAQATSGRGPRLRRG